MNDADRDASQGDILVTHPAPGVVLITLHRPDARNALRTRMLREIADTLAAADADAAARAVVITGGPACFAAGADIREMAPLGTVEVLLHERQRHWRAIAAFPKPLIAAVNGYALGGGCELALCADIVIAGSNAKFGQPEINLGMIPGAGGVQRLARSAGKARAMQMVLTGEPIDAEAALMAGIVVEIEEPDRVLSRALEIASVLAGKPALALRHAKAAVLRAFETPISEALAADRQVFALLAASHDRNEGIAAFLEKRPPHFTGN